MSLILGLVWFAGQSKSSLIKEKCHFDTQYLYSVYLICLLMETELARPAPIKKSVYVKFGNKCRSEGYEVSYVLEQLCLIYIKKRKKEKMF